MYHYPIWAVTGKGAAPAVLVFLGPVVAVGLGAVMVLAAGLKIHEVMTEKAKS